MENLKRLYCDILDTDALVPLRNATKALTEVGGVFRRVNLKPEIMVWSTCRCNQKIYEETDREIHRLIREYDKGALQQQATRQTWCI